MNNIKEGDYFILSKEKGYSESQRKQAMQVMELWPHVMTVKCNGGCITLPYDCFEKIESTKGFERVYHSAWFEDRR